jgi:hypothetical protein
MADRLTLLDIARQADPDGGPAQVVDVLTQTNAMLQDAPAYPANAPTGNRVTLRSSLPTVTFAKINQGVVRSKGATEQKVDTIGLIAGLSEVDSKLKTVVGDGAFTKARWNEDAGFLESMGQLAATTLLYGSEATNEASFTGFAPRMAALNQGTSIAASQVWDGGGSTARGSMFIIDWHERYVHLIYPEASIAGISTRDLGETRVTDADSNPMLAYVTAYDWSLGLTVKDPRHIGRLANIDTTDANLDSPTKNLINKLVDVMSMMPDPNGANRVIYCPPRLWSALWKQAINKSNAALSVMDYMGKGPTPAFAGYPIRRMDKATLAESAVA